MPRAQFVRPMEGINKSVSMSPPPRIIEVKNWVNKARKLIPDIPLLNATSNWFVASEIIDAKYIMLELRDRKTEERASLIFERTYNNIAGR